MTTAEKQARYLAKDNFQSEPDLKGIYWFPDESEVRLVELSPTALTTDDETDVEPFYFRAVPDDGLPLPTAIAIIHPDKYRRLKVPDGWCPWDQAKALEAVE